MTFKRGLAAPLLFCALALVAKGSVDASATLWLSALVALCVAAACLPERNDPYLTPLGLAVFGYATWLVLTGRWVNTYTSAATYDAGFLVGGFLLGRRAGNENAPMLLAVALVFAVALAAWSLWQRFAGIETRGHALFETPATLASTVNLVLLAGLVLVAAGKRNPWLIVPLGLLAGALVGTASRGGWIAFVAGAALALALLRRAAITVERKSILIVAGILLAGYLLALFAPLTWQTAFGTAGASGAARLDLYKTAVGALAHSSWLHGSGYLAFRYVLEAARPSTPAYEQAITYFVHNDYLQTLLELGAPGLVLLLLIAALPIAQTWKKLSTMNPQLRMSAIAIVAATTSMAVHALVDFPFYIAVCLVIYGACGGLLSSVLSSQSMHSRRAMLWPRIARAAITGIAIWILIVPAVAEAAAERARRQWSDGQGESAAYWFELARRIEPKDWRFHWYAGQFWFVQAQAGSNPAAARLADEAFRAGFDANPREVANLLWRISTHIYLRSLLPSPADEATLHEWGDRALALAPLDPGVKTQRELIARFEKKEKKARP